MTDSPNEKKFMREKIVKPPTNWRRIARRILGLVLIAAIFGAVAAASFTVWLLRDFAIWLLLSNKFTAMRDLFAWQLVGDVLKVGAYVFGYLVIAKASLRFYILAEVSQFTLLMVFAHWLIPAHGALGAAQAYMATYIVYFSLCCGVFLLWRRRA